MRNKKIALVLGILGFTLLLTLTSCQEAISQNEENKIPPQDTEVEPTPPLGFNTNEEAFGFAIATETLLNGIAAERLTNQDISGVSFDADTSTYTYDEFQLDSEAIKKILLRSKGIPADIKTGLTVVSDISMQFDGKHTKKETGINCLEISVIVTKGSIKDEFSFDLITENSKTGATTNFKQVSINGTSYNSAQIKSITGTIETALSEQDEIGYMYLKFTPDDDSEILEYILTAGIKGTIEFFMENEFITFEGIPVGMVYFIDNEIDSIELIASNTPIPVEYLEIDNYDEFFILGMLEIYEEENSGGILIHNIDNSVKLFSTEDISLTINNYGSEGNMMSGTFTSSNCTVKEGTYDESAGSYDYSTIDSTTYTLTGDFNVLRFLDIKVCYLTYDANGAGSYGGSYRESRIENQEVRVDSNYFNREGYTFKGWNTKADGSGISYKAGDTFTMGSASMTLYAIWEDSLKGTWKAVETEIIEEIEYTYTYTFIFEDSTFSITSETKTASLKIIESNSGTYTNDVTQIDMVITSATTTDGTNTETFTGEALKNVEGLVLNPSFQYTIEEKVLFIELVLDGSMVLTKQTN